MRDTKVGVPTKNKKTATATIGSFAKGTPFLAHGLCGSPLLIDRVHVNVRIDIVGEVPFVVVRVVVSDNLQ